MLTLYYTIMLTIYFTIMHTIYFKLLALYTTYYTLHKALRTAQFYTAQFYTAQFYTSQFYTAEPLRHFPSHLPQTTNHANTAVTTATPIQYSAVQYNAVQCSAVQCSAVIFHRLFCKSNFSLALDIGVRLEDKEL